MKLTEDIEVVVTQNEILFFPSGASTGGRFELARNGIDKKSIYVTIITGFASIDETEER
jgi:hypothetical protein